MKFALTLLLLAPASIQPQQLQEDCLEECFNYDTSLIWGTDWQLTIWNSTPGEGRDECTATCKRCSLEYSYSYIGSEAWSWENGLNKGTGSGSFSGEGRLGARCGATDYWFGESGPSEDSSGASVNLNCSCI